MGRKLNCTSVHWFLIKTKHLAKTHHFWEQISLFLHYEKREAMQCALDYGSFQENDFLFII